MEHEKIRIAIVSPNQNVFSETFIQAQKEGLQGKVYYYYGGDLPNQLEGYGKVLAKGKKRLYTILRLLKITDLKPNELAFYNSLKRNKIQVVIAQYGFTANRIIEICKRANVALITHFHGYDAAVNSVIEANQNYQSVFKNSRYVIAVSQLMYENLAVLGCPKEKLVYCPYGPHNDFLKVHANLNTQVFVGIGRFVNKKAPYLTILAFQKVVQSFPSAKLVLAGTGELLEVCVNLVKQLGLDKKVSFPGILSREGFIEYLKHSIAFVQHSVTALNGDQEGTPVAILEASAAGLPIIATRHAGIPDVIINNETGILVNEHDVEGMANAMISVLTNNELAQRLGENGKKRIQESFSMKKYLENIDELVKQCCNE
ncbi:glycosyltransferase family 4 protein [Flavobacterium chuncheonense]|uniref:Glycosyltransferase family 4 protein n=1 Tax=Flavobacterium chuncheonense TaxID=2026653 RepID=A0ABW5YIW5_9FLAO